jgi:hypothetical protein
LVIGRTLLGSLFTEAVVHGTQKVSTWNKKGFYLEQKRVLPGTKKGSTWNKKGFYLKPKRVLPET